MVSRGSSGSTSDDCWSSRALHPTSSPWSRLLVKVVTRVKLVHVEDDDHNKSIEQVTGVLGIL